MKKVFPLSFIVTMVVSYNLPPDSQCINKQKSLEKKFEPLMGTFVYDIVNKRLILQYEGKPCIKGRDATHPLGK
jgi:hypothetical protein